MRKFQRQMLIFMCAVIMCFTTACAGNAEDNGADQNEMLEDSGADHTTDKNGKVNDDDGAGKIKDEMDGENEDGQNRDTENEKHE